MDLIFEFILELFIEGGIEVSSNKKVSKWIRYPILVILILFFSIVILGIILIGIILLKENIFGGVLVILIGLSMLIGSVIKFRNIYLKKHIEK